MLPTPTEHRQYRRTTDEGGQTRGAHRSEGRHSGTVLARCGLTTVVDPTATRTHRDTSTAQMSETETRTSRKVPHARLIHARRDVRAVMILKNEAGKQRAHTCVSEQILFIARCIFALHSSLTIFDTQRLQVEQ